MKSIYWFRNDLRLNDNLSLNIALQESDEILFVYVHDIENEKNCSWGFKKMSEHRKLFLSQGLQDLKKELNKFGHSLNEYIEDSVNILNMLVKKYQINSIFCESILAVDELKKVKVLKDMNINVNQIWQSSLYIQEQLPFSLEELPDVFSNFRKLIEIKGIKPNKPKKITKEIFNINSITDNQSIILKVNSTNYKKSSFPISNQEFRGGEKSGVSYLIDYFETDKPKIYKETRNQLMGQNFSTKFSPWLAMGYISARQIFFYLKKYEDKVIKNESTYWIFFELLWRDYFRFSMIKNREKIFYITDLNSSQKNINHDDNKFKLWTEGKTQNNFINAGMNELKQTGFLSNRMRQIVASYLVNDLACDWRAGAAWFESQLIDYDIYSNLGNWLYISGFGADPRGGRYFNIEKQKKTYDPNSTYQDFWH
ncbi:DASH family cryptochrome [Nitrosomonadales bacterium]|nr:DASH family cryptochrome [Nitrosomonadales bacterium]